MDSQIGAGFYFAYSLVIENLISGFIFWGLRHSDNSRFSTLLPLQSSDSLIRTPKLKDVMPGQNFSDTVLIAVVLAYIVFFSWLSYRNFLKRDL
jgi:hypothetical protein